MAARGSGGLLNIIVGIDVDKTSSKKQARSDVTR